MVSKGIVQEVQNLLGIYGKMTIRQIYYQLISKGFMVTTKKKGTHLHYPKSGKSFENYLSVALCKARRNGIIDPSLIIDDSRELRYQSPFSDAKEFSQTLDSLIERLILEDFILDLWQDQQEMPVVIVEKFALGQIFEEVTKPYGVPLVVNRGFTSDAKLFELSTKIPSTRNLVFQMYSDYDPSGQQMVTSIQKTVKWYIPNNYRVEKGALTLQQVQNPKYNLQLLMKPIGRKKTMIQFCEIDALAPNDLKQIIRDNIDKQINDRAKFQQRLQEVANEKQNLLVQYQP